MRLVLDASIVLPLVGFRSPEADALRRWTQEVLDGDDSFIIEILTPIEVIGALRTLEDNQEIDPRWAETVRRSALGWPFKRERLTQARLERVWEMSGAFTPYDALYLAVTESLQSANKADVALLMANNRFSANQMATLPCQILTYPG